MKARTRLAGFTQRWRKPFSGGPMCGLLVRYPDDPHFSTISRFMMFLQDNRKIDRPRKQALSTTTWKI
jgi:hypothetical protein